MGDKLKRGWADEKAKAQKRRAESWEDFYFLKVLSPQDLRDREAEIHAEEAMLP